MDKIGVLAYLLLILMSFAVSMKVFIGMGSLLLRHIYHVSIHTENNTNQQHVFKSGKILTLQSRAQNYNAVLKLSRP